jgi:chromosome segregation ATPase
MSTVTSTTPSLASREAVDLTQLSHRNAHPALAPLLARRIELRQRLQAIRDETIVIRRELYPAFEQAETFSVRRSSNTRLAALEAEGAEVEQALAALHPEIEATEEAVAAQLKGPLATEGLQVVTRLVAALEEVMEAGEAYSTYSRRCQGLLGISLVPSVVFSYLPACLQSVQRAAERLAKHG